MFRYSSDSRPLYVCNLNRTPKEVIYLAQMSVEWPLFNTPGKLPIHYCYTQLFLGRSSPVCSLRGINHSAGLYPRFFFQDAFGISCKINCCAMPWSSFEGLLTAPRAISGGEFHFIPGHWALVSHSLGITPYRLLYSSSLTRVILPTALFPLKTVVTVVFFSSGDGY